MIRGRGTTVRRRQAANRKRKTRRVSAAATLSQEELEELAALQSAYLAQAAQVQVVAPAAPKGPPEDFRNDYTKEEVWEMHGLNDPAEAEKYGSSS